MGKTHEGETGRFGYYLGNLYRRMNENHLFLFAAGLAFVTFLGAIPSLFLMFFALGATLDAGSMARLVNGVVDAVFPYEIHAAHLKEILFARIPEVVVFKEAYGLSGLLILLVSTSSLFRSMRTILNAVFSASEREQKSRSALDKIRAAFEKPERKYAVVRALKKVVAVTAKYLLLVFLLVFLFLLSVISMPIMGAVADNMPILEAIVDKALHSYMGYLSIASFALIFAVFLSLYWLVPDERPRTKGLAIGALWAALLWELAKQGFGYYLSHSASIQYLYGAYLLLVVVALWIYYAAVIFILGAEIAQLYDEKHPAQP